MAFVSGGRPGLTDLRFSHVAHPSVDTSFELITVMTLAGVKSDPPAPEEIKQSPVVPQDASAPGTGCRSKR